MVTGVNRLTGVREVVSSPHTEQQALQLMLKYQSLQRKAGKRSAYVRLRVEQDCREGVLRFET